MAYTAPAFPTLSEVNGKQVVGSEGLSVREWYAGHALTGILVGAVLTGIGMKEHAEGFSRLAPPKEAADMAFEYADAMIAASKELER